MTDEIFDDNILEDEDPTQDNPLPKHLRKMYEQEKAKREAMERKVADLNKRVRTSELSKALSAKGLPEEAVDLFPPDVEITDESVDKWVTKYGPLFGSQKPSETPSGSKPTSDTQEVVNGSQNQSQGHTEGVSQMEKTLNQVSNVVGSGTPANGAKDYSQSIFNPNFTDEVPFDDFKDWLRSQGAKV
jgi:hypothetical protein